MSLPTTNWNYPTAIRFGNGRIGDLPAACNELGLKRPLLVTDPGIAKLPMIPDALASLEAAGLAFGTCRPSTSATSLQLPYSTNSTPAMRI